jgi:hypothetical protein
VEIDKKKKKKKKKYYMKLRLSVAGFSPRELGFNPRLIYIGFLVDTEIGFSPVTSVSPAIYNSPQGSIVICHQGLVQWA